jgi:hypothetical protein
MIFAHFYDKKSICLKYKKRLQYSLNELDVKCKFEQFTEISFGYLSYLSFMRSVFLNWMELWQNVKLLWCLPFNSINTLGQA